MRINKTSIALTVALVGAAGYALAHNGNDAAPPPSAVADPAPRAAAAREAPPIEEGTPLPANHPPIDQAGAASPHGGSPHGHGTSAGDFAPASDEPAALSWKADAAWKSLPNPSAMRLATYAVPHAGSDTSDAELAISRAGGDVESNVSRWEGQFEGGAKPLRKDSTVHGLKVTVVELDGTYSGGMGPQAGTHEGWAMLGAIVEAPGQPYFFKLTGPRATVRAAHAKWDALVASVSPTTSAK